MAWCLLTVPKSVAITNQRLNVFAWILEVTAICLVLWNFLTQKPFAAKIESHSNILMEIGAETGPSVMILNRTGHSMCPPWQSVEAADAIINSWSNFSADDVRQRAEARFAPAQWLHRNPPWLQASSTCLPMCTGMDDASHCMSPFTFMDQRDSSHVALWSARHILRKDGIFVDSFVGLSVVAATINLNYSWSLAQAVPVLSRWFFNPAPAGNHTTTQTVLINSKGVPGKRLPFGSQIKLTLTELLGLAQGIPQYLLESTQPWELLRDGLDLNLEVLCYSDDVELDRSGVAGSDGDWKLEATITSPVCVVHVKYMQCCAAYAAPKVTDGGSVALNRAVVVRAGVGASIMWFPSFNSLILALTSAIVLLQIPPKFLRWFVLHCLGQLSHLYRRVIVQMFDIQQEAATMSVNLMSNSVSFLELSDSVIGTKRFPGISRGRMEERMRAALQQRRHVLSDAELSAFVTCCFDALQFGKGDNFDIVKELETRVGVDRSTMLGTPKSDRSMTPTASPSIAKQGTFNEDVIDIDTFNVHCSMGHAVDLGTVVELFDDDRKRHCLERLFTPSGLRKALQTVRTARAEAFDQIPEEDSLEEDLDGGDLMRTTSKTSSLSGAPKKDWLSRQQTGSVSLEDKKNNEQRLRFTLLDLLEREREREQAHDLQAELVVTLQDRISALETEMRKAAAALQSLETEGTVRYSHGEALLSKVEENVEARILELDRSFNDRFKEVTFHNNPAADPPTPTEQKIQVAELADRLAMLDAELRHQSLAIKQTMKRTVASLEAQVGQQRIQIYTFADELRNERESRDSCNSRTESRLASLEATVGERSDGRTESRLASLEATLRERSDGRTGSGLGNLEATLRECSHGRTGSVLGNLEATQGRTGSSLGNFEEHSDARTGGFLANLGATLRERSDSLTERERSDGRTGIRLSILEGALVERSDGLTGSRLSNLEAALGEPAAGETCMSVQNHSGPEVGGATEAFDVVTSLATTKAGSRQSMSVTPIAATTPLHGEIVPGPASRRNGFKDNFCSRKTPRIRMCS